MSKISREKLKRLFANGMRPSAVEFEHLIDSAINTIDDGFSITSSHGIQVEPTEQGALASIYHSNKFESEPSWKFHVSKNGQFLELSNLGAQNTSAEVSQNEEQTQSVPILAIDSKASKIGVNKNEPACELDVNGTIASKAQVGTYATGQVEANGKWHDIITGLTGCHIFEVTAGVGGGQQSGRYALLKASAMNCYNPTFLLSWFRKRIRHQHAWYFSRWDRIILRWKNGDNETYRLQIKTIRDYGAKGKQFLVTYHVTQRWLDISMEKSTTEEGKQ